MKLDYQLSHLEQAQLIRPIAEADLAYIFKHTLTQETVYQTLLRKKRAEIHRSVAESLEQLYADRLDENAALLAEHYAIAEDDAKTLEFAMRAGDVAARVYANAEALAHYSRALDLARSDKTTNSKLLCDLFLRRGRVLELSGQFKSALANYQDAENLARERRRSPSGEGDRALELAALAAHSQIFCTANTEFNPEKGEQLAEQALRLARELGDRAVESKILWNLLNLYRFTNRLAQARAAGEQSAAIARELNLREQLAYVLNDMAHVHGFSGEFERAKTVSQEVTPHWRELGNLPMLADSLSTSALRSTFTGEFKASVEFAEEAHQISHSIANLWGQSYSLSAVGNAYWAFGDPARAIATMEESLQLSDQSGYPVPKLLTRTDLALVLANLGAEERGRELAQLALEFADANFPIMSIYAQTALVQINILKGDLANAAAQINSIERERLESLPLFSMHIPFAEIQLAFAQGDHARVLNLAPDLLERMRKFSLRPFALDVLYMFGCAQHALGQDDSARTILSQARVEAEAMNSKWSMWQILAALAEVEVARGQVQEANSLRDQAREIVGFIAEHTPPDPSTPLGTSLRASFLNLPDVRAVMKSR